MRRDLGPRLRRRLALLRGCISTRADAWLATRMVGWKLVLPVLKFVLPLSTLARLMWTESRHRPSADREAQIATLATGLYGPRSVRALSNCLERSLVAYRFLSEAGSDPLLVVGVGSADGDVKGHAWVTLRGEPVDEPPGSLDDFTPVVVFGPRGEATRQIAQPAGSETKTSIRCPT